jgi:hypothetical protein
MTKFHAVVCRLHLQPPGVQQRLGVAAGLLQALEHQVARGLVGGAAEVAAIGL